MSFVRQDLPDLLDGWFSQFPEETEKDPIRLRRKVTKQRLWNFGICA